MRKTMVLGYCRVSTDEQEKNGYSIASQIEDVKREASRRGYSIEDDYLFVDEGYSASTLKRPSMQAMIKVIAQSKDEKILISRHPDRLVRSLTYKRSLKNVFDVYNVKVICLQGAWEGTDSDSDVVSDISMLFSENEINKIPQRTIDGLRGSAELGNYPIGGVPPRGYKRVENSKLGKGTIIVPDEKTAGEVIKIFNTIVTNRVTIKQMVKYLNKKKCMDKKWTEKQLTKLLDNPIYYGHLVTNWFDQENHTEPLVSKELWMDVQKIIHSRKSFTFHDYIFGRITKCHCCNTYLTCESAWKTSRNGKRKTLYKYYYCPNCKKRMSEKKLVESFSNIYTYRQITIDNRDILESIKGKIEKVRRRIDFLNRDYDNDLIDDATYNELTGKAFQMIKNYKKDIDKIENSHSDRFDELYPEQQKAVIIANIELIVIDLDTKKINVTFRN